MSASSASCLHIAAIGAATAVGGYADASVAAQQCQLPNFIEHPYLLDLQGSPYVLACAPYLDVGLQGLARFNELINYAISDCCADKDWLQQHPIPSVLCLPQERPNFRLEHAHLIAQRLARDCPGLCLTSQDLHCQGHAGAYLALTQVQAYLRQPDHEFCLLAAVDSMIDSETLNRLDMNRQIHRADNAYGFIPGEAAACIVFCTQTTLEKYRLSSAGTIVGFAYADELVDHRVGVCTGEGLTRVMKGALSYMPVDQKIRRSFCDLNGEPHRSDEFGFALTRLSEHFSSPDRFTAPADCWGDVGAASAVLSMMLAAAEEVVDVPAAEAMLLWASSMKRLRGAALFYPSIGYR